MHLGAMMAVRKRAPQQRRKAPPLPFDRARILKQAGEVVAHHRRRLRPRLTQDQLGLQIGVTKQAIKAFENGETWLRIDLLLHICTILQLTMCDLIVLPSNPRTEELHTHWPFLECWMQESLLHFARASRHLPEPTPLPA